MNASLHRGGKTRSDENFPVASRLIAPRHRSVILAFYAFARTADDVVDNPRLQPSEKLKLLRELEDSLEGANIRLEGIALRNAMAERGLDFVHARELLVAFRQDVLKKRYGNWNDLIEYCRYSAVPVGRFVLDVHGERRETWRASDSICAALQIVNHIQDCAKDYRALDRLYLPLDDLACAGATAEMLSEPQSSPQLRHCLDLLIERTAALLDAGRDLPRMVADARLSLEIAVIINLARRQLAALRRADPLREQTRLGVSQTARASLSGLIGGAAERLAHRYDGGGTESDSLARRASGSSFYSAMRILPRERRDAMLQIYGFCRAVDDIADEGGEREVRLAALDRWRCELDAVFAGRTPHHLQGLAMSIHRFDLDKRDFHSVIDGMEMDVREDICAPDLSTLDLYCDRVASAVGRLSVKVFGVDGADGAGLAHHLGRALQLTNILRDLDEDASIGRLYLPREALELAEIEISEPHSVLAHRHIGIACEHIAAMARDHYAQSYAIMNRALRRAVRAPRIMADVYSSVLDALCARGWTVPRTKISVPRTQLARIILRHAVF
jgi:hydroxysqualene synthase